MDLVPLIVDVFNSLLWFAAINHYKTLSGKLSKRVTQLKKS